MRSPRTSALAALGVFVGCASGPPNETDAGPSVQASPAAPPVVATTASAIPPRATPSAPTRAPQTLDAGVVSANTTDAGATAVYDVEAFGALVAANPEAYRGKVVTVRGRYTTSTLDAGFPFVHFRGASEDASKKSDDDEKHTCQGEFQPGVVGAKFPRNTLILATGTVAVAPRSGSKPNKTPLDHVSLSECTVKRAR